MAIHSDAFDTLRDCRALYLKHLRALLQDFGRWRELAGRIPHTDLARMVLDESVLWMGAALHAAAAAGWLGGRARG